MKGLGPCDGRALSAGVRGRLGRLLVVWCVWLVLTCPPVADAADRCWRVAERLAAGITHSARHVAGWAVWRHIACGTRRVAGSVWRVLRAAGGGLGRATAGACGVCWEWVEPWVQDAAGWLVHSSPRWVGRLIGRTVRDAFRGGWRVLRYAGTGTKWLAVRLGPYLVGYTDFRGVLAEAISEQDVRREKRLREAWRATATRRLTAAVLLLTAAGSGVAVVCAGYGLLPIAGIILMITVVMAVVGRVARGRQARTPEEKAKAEGEPFPIADAHTRAEAAACVSRAVAAEGIELRSTGEPLRQPWGWQVPVILKRGTPAELVDRLGALETTLDLPANGLLAAPDRSRRARVVLRLAQRDPFDSMPSAPHREPGSLSIVDKHVVGQQMDGTDLALCLLGVHVVVIGVPGSGKSITLRTLADVVSVCRDAVVWDLDPAGSGLDVLGDAMARRERDPAGIERALADAATYAQVRPRLLSTLGMGDAWRPSREHPVVVVFVDEHTHLSERAKGLAVRLLRTGRKARITLVLAASEATSDAVGAAIAESVAVKILHPCRHHDVRLTLGPNMLAEGWRPDRLNPESGDSPEDAGKAYVYAAGHRDPIVSKIRAVDRDRAWENSTERAAHVPVIDRDTLDAARVYRAAEPDTQDAGAVVDGRAVADVLAVFDGHEKLWTDAILTGLATVDSDRYGTWTGKDLAAQMPPGVVPVEVKINGVNRRGYHRQVIADAWHTYQHGSRS